MSTLVILIGTVLAIKTWLSLSTDVIRDLFDEGEFRMPFVLYMLALLCIWVYQGTPSLPWVFSPGTFSVVLEMFILSGLIAFGFNVFNCLYWGCRAHPVLIGVPAGLIGILVVLG